MNFRWIVVAVAALGVLAADPAVARVKHKHHANARCVDQPVQFSWDFIWALRPDPQPNGCSPAAYDVGRFVGQDRIPIFAINCAAIPTPIIGLNDG